MDISLNEYKAPVASADLADGSASVQAATDRSAREGRGEAGADATSRLSILWRHRGLWLLPLASEGLLLAVAANMALAFGKVMRSEADVPDWSWVAGFGAAFVLARICVAWRELFLPRAIAFWGVAILGGVATAMLVGILVTEPWHEAFKGLSAQYRLLAGLPLILFLGRMAGVLHAARFNPALHELDKRHKGGGPGMWEELRRRLEFWMR